MNVALSFDPMASVAVATPEPERVADTRLAPAEWSRGLTLLDDRHCPRFADPARWQQVARDARSIAERWALDAIEEGWSVENLFGFDPDGHDLSLAVAARGSSVSIHRQYAYLTLPAQVRVHYPRLTPGTSLLWNFREPRPK